MGPPCFLYHVDRSPRPAGTVVITGLDLLTHPSSMSSKASTAWMFAASAMSAAVHPCDIGAKGP